MERPCRQEYNRLKNNWAYNWRHIRGGAYKQDFTVLYYWYNNKTLDLVFEINYNPIN